MSNSLSITLISSENLFLDAPTHLYKRLCPSVGLSVGLSAGHGFVKTAKNGKIRGESWLSP